VLNFLQGFPKNIVLGVAMEWQLGDEVVSAVELEYGFSRVINFDPTVGSCSNFYRGFQRLFLLG
jgi:hypothetical protein